MHALTIFLGSFLLFQVQPLIGKYILPWFGGTPAVWTTCLLFFQLMLLAGYSYAHLIALRLPARIQAGLHTGLLAATLLLLPIAPSPDWKGAPTGDPTWQILALLAVTIGGPYLMLSATAPLLQSWFSRAYPGRSPFRLYALSNVGSLLALFSFPLVFERFLPLPTQSWLWSLTYGLFVVVCGLCAWRLWQGKTGGAAAGPGAADANTSGWCDRTGARVMLAGEETVEPPAAADILLWLGLTACGSVMLMATTNQICQDVAAVPFLWVLPLSLYLLSFVICFDREGWYRRSWFALALIAGVVLSSGALFLAGVFSVKAQIAIHSWTLFACCMCCHGELVRLKPHPAYLTLFYLLIAAGGAVGGILVALAAPVVFSGYYEFPVGMAASCLMVLLAGRRRRVPASTPARVRGRWPVRVLWGVAGLLAVFLLRELLDMQATPAGRRVIAVDRNFYGAVRVSLDDPETPARRRMTMAHGTTIHGFQFRDQRRRREATMYYVRQSGVGLALSRHPRRGGNPGGLRIGVIGLGTGTLAAYAQAGDYLRFYEINPSVVRLAEEQFTFLEDARAAGADLQVWLGDARIVLEQQLAQAQSQRFDILVVDAFSSDAIPVHLLTRQSADAYVGHLAPDGVLAIHVSNRSLDLSPVVRGLAEHLGQEACPIDCPAPPEEEGRPQPGGASEWILVTGNKQFLSDPEIARARHAWPAQARPPQLWTDDFSSLLGVLR
jgi:hypothetical protein